MVVTVFRSRLRPEAQAEYLQWAPRMGELARRMPGYVSHKVFVAEDGERCTIVEFETEEAQRAWRMHPEHAQAQNKGRQEFYSEYRLQICSLLRESRLPAKK
jgi:heme-degrading monooxygenase HmoA